MLNKYRIFSSEDGDWFVAAKMENGKVTSFMKDIIARKRMKKS